MSNVKVNIKAELPKQYDTATIGSFARGIIENNYPKLLNGLANNFGTSKFKQSLLKKFENELITGKVEPPRNDNSLSRQWAKTENGYFESTWLNLPSYWAESYFFYRLGEIFDYTTKAGSYEDPFLSKKLAEINSDNLALLLKKCDAVLENTKDKSSVLYQGMILSLLGNMADLSHDISKSRANVGWDVDHILSNKSNDVLFKFVDQKQEKLTFVADNSGEELIFDLLLCILLLKYDVFEEISFHVKPYPFFVSDATLYDVQLTLISIPDSHKLKNELNKFISLGKLNFKTDYFYTSPYFYYQLPTGLFNEFKLSSCIIMKGDLNYRRLLGDARWEASTKFEKITEYFPSPLVVLRVMKSDIAVGIESSIVSFLDNEDPSWRYNGKYSIVQYRW